MIHLLMVILCYYKIERIKSPIGALAVVYYSLITCVYFVMVHRCYMWIVRIDKQSFELKFILVILHQSFHILSPSVTHVLFGLLRFDARLWFLQMSHELRTNKLLAVDETGCDSDPDPDPDSNRIRWNMYFYANVAVSLSYTFAFVYLMGLTNWIDYIPLPMLELMNLAPNLYYLYVISQFVRLNEVIVNELVECRCELTAAKSIAAAFSNTRQLRLGLGLGLGPRHGACQVATTLHGCPKSMRRRMANLMVAHKKVVQTCYGVPASEYGMINILIIITYSLGFIHDSVFTMKLPPLARIPSLFRTAHKLTFLVIFFGINENAKLRMKRTIKRIYDVIIREPTVPTDTQLKNFAMSYLHRDLTFKAYGVVNITYKQLLSISAMILGYIIVQIQFQR